MAIVREAQTGWRVAQGELDAQRSFVDGVLEELKEIEIRSGELLLENGEEAGDGRLEDVLHVVAVDGANDRAPARLRERRPRTRRNGRLGLLDAQVGGSCGAG